MGKSKSQTTKTTSTPWAPQGDALKDVFTNAQNLYKTNSGPNADMTAAWNMARDNATNPNSGFGKARSYYEGILNSGGYDDNVFKNITSPIIANVNSQFMGSGRTGGGLQGIDLMDTMTKAFSPFAVSQANMAASALPQIDAQNANAMYGIGQQQYDMPWNALGKYYGIIGSGNWGGTTKTKTPGQSMLPQLLGAGIGLAGSALSGGVIPPNVGMGMGSAAGSAFGSIY